MIGEAFADMFRQWSKMKERASIVLSDNAHNITQAMEENSGLYGHISQFPANKAVPSHRRISDRVFHRDEENWAF